MDGAQTTQRVFHRRRIGPAARVGGILLIAISLLCVGTLPWTTGYYDSQYLPLNRLPPSMGQADVGKLDPDLAPEKAPARLHMLLGSDRLGRSLFARCLLGGAISLGIGLAAAAITMAIGTAWGLVSGYAGGRTDTFMMRTVDVLYGLPYILLVVLLVVAFQPAMDRWLGTSLGNVVTLLVAIGSLSWLTLARVVRGQVLSLKSQPFVEAARATGCSTSRILLVHILPNLIGPIVVYTTLAVPQAILQESFLSFLGIGVRPPLPSWGNLAAEGLSELNPVKSHAWLLAWPALLLGLTLLALNFLGDGVRDRYDPRLK